MTEIAISDNDAWIQYTAVASQTQFDYDFPIYDADHLVVEKTATDGTTITTLTRTTDYTVSNVGEETGGTVTLVSGATADEIYTIYRDIPVARTSDYSTAGSFTAAAINMDLDKLIQMVQQSERDVNRAIALKRSDTRSSTNVELPIKSECLNKYLAFDSNGSLTVTTGTGTDNTLRTDLASTTAGSGIDLVESSIKVLDSISDLVGETGSANKAYLVKGYHSATGGGGGLFIWVAAQNKNTHDGATIIDPDIVFPTTWSNQTQVAAWYTNASSGQGCFMLLHNNIIIDLQFGVVRDGSTENGYSLQEMCTSAKTNGYSIQLTAGKAVTSRAMTIDTTDFSMIGPGQSICQFEISATFPTSGYLLTVNDCDRSAGTGTYQPYRQGTEKVCVLKGFSLYGNGRATRAHGLYYQGLNDEAELDISVYDFKGHGVLFGDTGEIDSMRECRLSLHVRNCGDDKSGNDLAAVHIGGAGTDAMNNLWFDHLAVVFSRGVGLRILPESTVSQFRKIHVKMLFLHGLRSISGNDPQGESYTHNNHLCEVGNASGTDKQVTDFIVDYANLVGVENNYSFIHVLADASLHVQSYVGFSDDTGIHLFQFTGSQTSSVMGRKMSPISVDDHYSSAVRTIKVNSMATSAHHVHVSNISGTTIPTGTPGYSGDLKCLIDHDAIAHNVYRTQDSAASDTGPWFGFVPPNHGRRYIQKLVIYPNSTLTANDTNYATITFQALTTASGFGATVAQTTTETSGSGGTGDWAQGEPVIITPTDNRIEQSEGLGVQITKAGSGVIVPHITIIAVLSPNLSIY